MTGCEPIEVICRGCGNTGISITGGACVCVRHIIKNSLEKRIEALEKHKRRQIDENRAVHRELEQLRQERDKGVERLKKLEEAVQELIIRNNEFLTDCKTMNARQNAFSKHLNEKGLQYCNEWHEISQRLEVLESRQSQDNIVIETITRHSADGQIHESETQQLAVCKHIVPLKFGCHLCHEEKQQNPVADVAQEPKTVSVYEAIKALREGKIIWRIEWPSDAIVSHHFVEGFYTVGIDFDDLLADDWIIKDEL